MHVQCAADADNILEESMLSRTESISSIDEPKNEVIKNETPSESMEVETSIVKSEEQPNVKNEKEEVSENTFHVQHFDWLYELFVLDHFGSYTYSDCSNYV